jgi:hypothetical protein
MVGMSAFDGRNTGSTNPSHSIQVQYTPALFAVVCMVVGGVISAKYCLSGASLKTSAAYSKQTVKRMSQKVVLSRCKLDVLRRKIV